MVAINKAYEAPCYCLHPRNESGSKKKQCHTTKDGEKDNIKNGVDSDNDDDDDDDDDKQVTPCGCCGLGQ